MAFNSVDISSSISSVVFDCTNNTYDRSLTKSGNVWSVTIPFVPAAYSYNFDLTLTDGSGLSNLRDPHEYGNAGGNSQIIVSTFSTLFNITSFTDNVSYDLRAVASDTRGNTDNSPSYITIVYDSSIPSQPVVTEPVAPTNRLKADGSTSRTIKASVSDTYGISVVMFQYSNDGGTSWNRFTSSDTEDSDGWSVNWTPSALAGDTTYYIRVFARDTAGNLSNASLSYPVILDVTDPTITNFSIISPSTTTTMNSGTRYTLIAETLDADISSMTFTHTLSSGNWIPAATIISKTGSGTISDPYKYTVYFEPTNANTQKGTLSVTMRDYSGRFAVSSITVNSIDVTPSAATLSQINIDDDGDGVFDDDTVNGADTDSDGLVDEDDVNPVTAGSNIYIGRNGAFLQATVSNLDGGTVKFQYSTTANGPWTTIEEKVAVSTVVATTNPFIPLSFGLAEGTYFIRALATDNDTNIDANPTVISVIYDGTEPTITTFTTPSGTIDCARPFTLYAKTNATDVSKIVFQYYDPISGWVIIDMTTAGRFILLTSSNTPSAVGLSEQTITVTAPNVTQATSLQVRAFTIDKAGNRNTDTAHAPVSTISLNDTAVPIAIICSAAGGEVSAETSEANVKSVLFQYRSSGSSIWMD